MLALLMAAALASPPIFQAPDGWEDAPPLHPVNGRASSMLLPKNFDGRSIVLTVRPREKDETLDSVTSSLIEKKVSDGQSLVEQHARATCAGRVAGTDVELNGVAAHYYHIAIKGKYVYMILFTRPLDGDVDPDIQKSIDALCPP